MPRYFANSPMSRLQYVIKTYRNQPKVVIDTLQVAFTMLGIHDVDFNFVVKNADPYDMYLIGPEMRLSEVLTKYAPRLAQHFRYDFIFPWFAREFARSFRREAAGQQDPAYTFIFRNEAIDRGTAIAQWAEDNRVDLTKTDLETAVRETKKHVITAKIVAAEVVYRFSDGWTVQLLTTPEQLESEGEVMQQCVGEYCERVRGGKSVIYSLRDSHGRPHVTIEFDPQRQQFKQVYGKQNQSPREEYAARVRTFIRERFNGEPLGMIMAGADPKTLNLRGRDLRSANMGGIDLSGADLSWSDFSLSYVENARLHRADLTRAKFAEANMRNADLTGADLSHADLTHANMYKARLLGAIMIGANLKKAFLHDANMQNVILVDANLEYADLNGADLEGAELRGANLCGARLYGAHMEGVDVSEAYWDYETTWPHDYWLHLVQVNKARTRAQY